MCFRNPLRNAASFNNITANRRRLVATRQLSPYIVSPSLASMSNDAGMPYSATTVGAATAYRISSSRMKSHRRILPIRDLARDVVQLLVLTVAVITLYPRTLCGGGEDKYFELELWKAAKAFQQACADETVRLLPYQR